MIRISYLFFASEIFSIVNIVLFHHHYGPVALIQVLSMLERRNEIRSKRIHCTVFFKLTYFQQQFNFVLQRSTVISIHDAYSILIKLYRECVPPKHKRERAHTQINTLKSTPFISLQVSSLQCCVGLNFSPFHSTIC